MDAVWVGPIAAASAGIVGVFFTWLAGQQGRKHNETLAAAAQAHEEQMAQRSRRADAYVDMLHSANQIGEWVQRLRPWATVSPTPEQLPLPSPAEQTRTWSLVTAFGSADVRRLYEEWRDAANAIRQADFKISLHEQTVAQHGAGTSGIKHLEVWNDLEDSLRPAEAEKRAALEEQVNKELRGA